MLSLLLGVPCRLSSEASERLDGRPVYELDGLDGLDGRFWGLWDTAQQQTDCTDASHNVAKVRVASSNLVIRSRGNPAVGRVSCVFGCWPWSGVAHGLPMRCP